MVEAGLQPLVFLLLPPKCSDYRHNAVPGYIAYLQVFVSQFDHSLWVICSYGIQFFELHMQYGYQLPVTRIGHIFPILKTDFSFHFFCCVEALQIATIPFVNS